MAKPDAVLFNGGFCIPAIARERITEPSLIGLAAAARGARRF
jgi:hypothetical protein